MQLSELVLNDVIKACDAAWKTSKHPEASEMGPDFFYELGGEASIIAQSSNDDLFFRYPDSWPRASFLYLLEPSHASYYLKAHILASFQCAVRGRTLLFEPSEELMMYVPKHWEALRSVLSVRQQHLLISALLIIVMDEDIPVDLENRRAVLSICLNCNPDVWG